MQEKSQNALHLHTYVHTRACTHTHTHTQRMAISSKSFSLEAMSINSSLLTGREGGCEASDSDSSPAWKQVKPRRLEINGGIIQSHKQDHRIKASTVSGQTTQSDRLEKRLEDTLIFIHYFFSVSQRKRHSTKHHSS